MWIPENYVVFLPAVNSIISNIVLCLLVYKGFVPLTFASDLRPCRYVQHLFIFGPAVLSYMKVPQFILCTLDGH